MDIDQRIEALTMNLELASRDIQDLKIVTHDLVEAAKQDGENIRALARICRDSREAAHRPRDLTK
jgi:hypothetical protein